MFWDTYLGTMRLGNGYEMLTRYDRQLVDISGGEFVVHTSSELKIGQYTGA